MENNGKTITTTNRNRLILFVTLILHYYHSFFSKTDCKCDTHTILECVCKWDIDCNRFFEPVYCWRSMLKESDDRFEN